MSESTDPFEENAPAQASLATGYERQSGEMMVYGGTFFGMLLLLAAVMSATPGLYAVAFAMLGCAFYFYPMVKPERPQLAIEPKGLYLDGLGWLPWTAIRDVRMFDQAVRTIRNSQLDLTLAGKANELVLPGGDRDMLREFMTRIWSIRRAPNNADASLVRVRLEPLRATPEEILACIRRYHPGA